MGTHNNAPVKADPLLPGFVAETEALWTLTCNLCGDKVATVPVGSHPSTLPNFQETFQLLVAVHTERRTRERVPGAKR